MQVEQVSTEHLLLEIERLRQEVKDLKQENADLELVLETTTAHADTIEIQLQESNKKLQAEIVERKQAQALLQALTAELQSLVETVSQDKADLEILLETITEHSDAVGGILHDKAAELQSLVKTVSLDKTDLEILLDTITEHGDTVGNILYDKAEEEVRNGEKKLIKFLEAVPVGITVLDPSGKPYYHNCMAKQLLSQGWMSSASVQGLAETFQVYLAGTKSLYPNDQLPAVQALKGESTTADDLEVRQGDKVIPLECWGTPIFDEKGNVAYAIVAFQDITERKRAEAESSKFTRELYQLNEAYQRFVPRQFLEFLNKESIVDVRLGDQVQQEMSVLFADIRDFTTLSESITPQETFNFINAFFSRMEPTIIENQGFIDKYIGDAIMALFSGGADNAVKAGLAMLQVLAEYNRDRAKSGYLPIAIGIGINTGSLMLGTVGGVSRMDSTVIGDTVNLASRLESLTKEYGVSLLISHHTFVQLQDFDRYAFRLIDRVKVKGKTADVSVYEIFDADLPEVREGKLLTKQEFEQALLLYNLGHASEAAKLFENCLRINPRDTVAQIYWERCQSN